MRRHVFQYWREVHSAGTSWMRIASFVWHFGRATSFKRLWNGESIVYHEEPRYLAEDLEED